MTVCDDISGQAKANGKREYSSIIVNRNRLREEDGRGPLKSMLSLSKGMVAFIRCERQVGKIEACLRHIKSKQ